MTTFQPQINPMGEVLSLSHLSDEKSEAQIGLSNFPGLGAHSKWQSQHLNPVV